MSVYFVATYNIDDRATYDAYPAQVGPLLQKHGAEVLVADYHADALEGAPREVCIVLRFPSRDAALAWYHDPDYKEPRELRLRTSSDGIALIAAPF
ncbi:MULTISPECIES: DUF1330 domain-containing protein [Burkholderia cepacia complex]|uniref:DUF1330 domain-containing protein n=1 Tax=Burkholderia cepacia complex TaxID=87882 RepID=UPI001CF10220|nr:MULTISPECIES: DUF1330 domain-containing protein [Burkholderia cepacia complex]MCA8057346.1 DUF1330 domain-containing protein [Burkholderia cepacia]MDN7531331.1 DUF1330 domain-containing protein [Burkholderia orbicola]